MENRSHSCEITHMHKHTYPARQEREFSEATLGKHTHTHHWGLWQLPKHLPCTLHLHTHTLLQAKAYTSSIKELNYTWWTPYLHENQPKLRLKLKILLTFNPINLQVINCINCAITADKEQVHESIITFLDSFKNHDGRGRFQHESVCICAETGNRVTAHHTYNISADSITCYL